MPLLLHAAQLLLALLCSMLLALLCLLLLSLRAPSGSSTGSLPKLCCSLLEFSPHTRGTCLRQGRKTKDNSRSITFAAACLGCISMCSRFWSRAKSLAVLGGTLGENAAWCSGHGSSVQADGCGLSPAAGPAQHVVLCGHRSVFTSPPGRRMFRLLAFFHEPSAPRWCTRDRRHFHGHRDSTGICSLPALVYLVHQCPPSTFRQIRTSTWS